MKTEHEKLKEIIDLIDFSWGWPIAIIWNETNKVWERINYKNPWICDVREIIFTNTFQRYLVKYLWSKNKLRNIIEEQDMSFDEIIMDNLDNPVEYLYNLLELWTHKK